MECNLEASEFLKIVLFKSGWDRLGRATTEIDGCIDWGDEKLGLENLFTSSFLHYDLGSRS